MSTKHIEPYRVSTFVVLNDDGDQELEKIEEYNSHDDVVYRMTINEGEKIEEHYIYDGGKLQESKVFRDGEEIDKEIFHYDAEGRVVEREHLINGELFEKEINEYGEGGYERILMQDDLIVDRVQVIEKDPLNYSLEIFEHEEPLEKHIQEFDENSNEGVLKVFTPDGQQSHEIRFKHDDEGREVFKTMTSGEFTIKESTWEFEGDLLVKEVHKDFEEGAQAWKAYYFYDDKKQLSRMETRSLTDQLLAFENYSYDKEGRLIETVGTSEGGFNAVFGTYKGNDGFHYRFIYEDIT